MFKKKLTISDVAELAGVSKTTISHFLNGKFEYMSDKTRKHIQEIINESGYQPSKIAQSLKSQNSYIIGVIVSDIESPFSSALIKSIEQSLEGSNYLLMTANSDNSIEKEEKAVEAMLAQQVDGLIINTTSMDNPYVGRLKEGETPIVLADNFINNHDFDIAFIDNHKPIKQLVKHLTDEGYEDLYFFSQEYDNVAPRYYRVQNFKNEILSHYVGEDDRVRVIDINNIDEAKAYIVAIMEEYVKTNRRPAIIAGNGMTLLFLSKCIKELGIKLPEELGLCGYDDWGRFTELGWADMLVGGITTVSPSIHTLGKEVTELLLNRIANRQAGIQEVIIEAPIQIRNSTEYNSYMLKKESSKVK